MYVELQKKEVKTRKAHRCAWCNDLIPTGSRASYRSYIWEDGLQSGWMHLECNDAMGECDNRDLEEGWMPGDYGRGSTEWTG